MKALRRAWRVLADTPASTTARDLRAFIVLGIPAFAVSAIWLPGVVKLNDLVWMYVVLWVVRQRDQARTAIARVRAIKRAPGVSSVSSYVRGQDDGWDQALTEGHAALDEGVDRG